MTTSTKYLKAPDKLELNPLKQGRRPLEKLKPVFVEEFDAIEPAPPPKKWAEAPGMPYDPGTAKVRTGKTVEWTEEEKEELKRAQARGDRVRVAQMMKEKQDAMAD